MKRLVVEHWGLINSLARKRFGETALAEEAVLFVVDGLVDDGGRRLRGYRGKAPFGAFLSSLSWSLLEDFSRKRYGRRRPPSWVRNLGGIWLRLYMLLCFERMNVEEAIQTVEQERMATSFLTPEDAAWKIKEEVVDCGSHQGLEVGLDDGKDAAGDGTCSAGTVDAAEEREKNELFRMLFAVLTDVEEGAVERSREALSSLKILLAPEEKLLLKLCYQDGLNVTRAGKMLGLNRHQAHGRMRRLLARVRKELELAGLDQEILELLR